MKKSLLFAALAVAGVAATSCSNDQELMKSPSVGDELAISFSTFAPPTQRTGAVTSETQMRSDGFDVFAYKVGDQSTFMGNGTDDGVEIAHNGTNWDYKVAAEKTLWVGENDPVNFHAVWPADHTGYSNKTIAATTHTTTFTVPQETTKHVDLMYAKVENAHINDRDGNGSSNKPTTGAVVMEFKHMLAQLLFKVTSSHPNLKVEVSQIGIHNIFQSGDLNFDAATWSNLSTKGCHTVSIDTTNSTATTSMMVIPQPLTAWDKNPITATTTSSYIVAMAKLINTKGGESYLYGDSITYKPIYIPISGSEWTAGNQYTYTLNFGDDGSGSGGGGYDDDGDPILQDIYISFTPTVTTWQSQSSTVTM